MDGWTADARCVHRQPVQKEAEEKARKEKEAAEALRKKQEEEAAAARIKAQVRTD